MRKLGYDVTTNVGGFGIVAILKNGTGPTLMIRTDMDALPVREQTGLPYASKVTTHDDAGIEVPVMHACGHDVHMASWIGTATILAQVQGSLEAARSCSSASPPRSGIVGAKMMLEAGLFQKFPEARLSRSPFTTTTRLPRARSARAGLSSWRTSTPSTSSIYGRGGHGAYPQSTVDPIVIAARTVVALQTIVARENNPLDPP